jgi:F-type H+-transporting ATPase subunit epsilon
MAGGVLHLRIVSPTETVFEGEATSLVASAWDGKVGILPSHAPMVVLLGGGMLTLDLPGGGSREFFLNRGVLKVENDQVTVLSEFASDSIPEDFDSRTAWLDPADLEEMSFAGNPLS